MTYRLLADVVALAHLAFVVFVVLGGLLVLRWPRLAWVHLPCAVWGGLVELTGWVCPLTPLEIWARQQAGATGYAGGFIDHYLIPLLYPAGLTRPVQLSLAVGVVMINTLIYAHVHRRRRARK